MKVKLVLLLIGLLVITPPSVAYDLELGIRDMKLGMQGNDVQQLQETLVSVGYDLAIDGIYGLETVAIITQIQEQYDLEVDGIAGNATLKTIRYIQEQCYVYEVVKGDTLYDISRMFRVPVERVTKTNQLSSSLITPGQKLLIPGISVEQEYVVRSGENLSSIAYKFGVSTNDLASYNQISDPNRLRPGQTLTIPQVAVPAMSHHRQTLSFSWPVSGRISSPYGWRIHPISQVRHFHGGIDIAAASGTIIRAAAAGEVTTAGWMGNFGYGVVIDHGGGYTSWYGHSSALLVRVGERVDANQPIAKVGSTGVSTGPHLDFRIKYYGQTVDPNDFLP